MASSWLLREPLKGTAAINFSLSRLGQIATNSHGRELLQNMTQKRGQLLERIAQLRGQPDGVEEAFRAYMTDLRGLMVYLGVAGAGQDDEAEAKEAKAKAEAKDNEEGTAEVEKDVSDEGLRRRARQAISWKWSDNVSSQINTRADLTFEANNMMINFGLWNMKHAAVVADNLGPQADTDESAKEIFNCLRRAAGVFQYLLDQHRSELAYLPNTDYDERMMEVRVQQCIAEAQEVTLERARSLNHKPPLISAIARDEHDRYQQAADALKSMDNKLAKRQRAFLLFKSAFYKAYMYCYAGIAQFGEEKCGDAIRSLNEAKASMEEARKMAKAYVRIPVGSQAPPDPVYHPVFTILEKTIKDHADKYNRENGFIYTQRIPVDAPEAPEAKSLTELMPFEAPPATDAWEVASLDLKKVVEKGQNPAADKASGDDAKVKHSPFDPVKPRGRETSDSVCVLS